MFRNTALTFSTLIALSTSAFAPLAGSALAEESTAPIPAAVEAVQPKGQILLQGVLDEFLQGKSEFAQMQPLLRVNLMQQPGMIPSLSERLKSLGGLQSVTFAGVQDGAEVYDVRFANASMAWGLMLAPDGKISKIRWKFH